MGDDNRQEQSAIESILSNIVVPLVGLAVTYWVGTHAASIEIEIRSRIAKVKAAVESVREGQAAGRKVAEWWVQAESRSVIEAAEAITKEGGNGGEGN